MLKSGQVWTGNFVTLDATGLPAAATVGPVGALYVAGVANGAAVTISGANPYKFSVTLPALTAGQSVGMYATATVGGIATAGFVAEDIADTKLTSDLNDIPAGALMGLADDAITSAKFDEASAFPLKAADVLSTQVMRVGADGDTAETLSDQLDVAQADLDTPAQYKADVSGLATSAALAAVSLLVDDLETRLTALRAGYLDNLSAGPVALASALTTVAANVTTLLARIGAFTGTGVNTILGFLKAVMSKAASTPSDVGGTFSAATDSLEALQELVASHSTGAGAITWTYTLLSSVDGVTPIADADVWVTTDLAGTNIIATGRTDALGQVTFYLDAGQVYIFRQKSGWNFVPNPDPETVV